LSDKEHYVILNRSAGALGRRGPDGPPLPELS
jgi:hypothetical protein